MTPLFSVVIPVYNSAAYICDTLRSLASQAYRGFEVVVVDDGSRDGTAELADHECRRLGLVARVCPRAQSLGKGVSSCRNQGIRLASGEWIAFLDSDDLFTPDKLARSASEIARYDAGADALYHRCRRFEDGTGTPMGEVSAGSSGPPRPIIDELLRGNFLATCGMVIRRRLLLDIGGFRNELGGAEDYWLALQVATRTSWMYVDERLADIRIRPSSLNGRREFAHYAGQATRLLSIADKSEFLDADQIRTMRHHLLRTLVDWYAGQSHRRGGWSELWPGILVLARGGEMGTATLILWRHLRYDVISWLQRGYRKLRHREERTAA